MPRLLDEIAASWRGRGETLGLGRFLLLLAISALAAFVLARLYVRFFGGRATGSDVHRSFPLLAIAVTSIFVCIQFSLPLSLGLLGALSIVRFRTPIKEPEEVGFIMLVIAISIATATFKLAFVGLILLVALVALLLQMRHGVRRRGEGTLVVTVPDAAVLESTVTDAVRRHIAKAQLESLSRHDQQLVMSYAVRDMAPAAVDRLQADLDTPTAIVHVDGRVKVPGDYPLERNMTVRDLVRAGGSLSDAAYGGRAELTRYKIVDGESRSTELIELDGESHLERVRWRDNRRGETEARNIRHVFILAGAIPATQWLSGCLALDERKFVKTGADLSPDELERARWPLTRPPFLLETTLPGVFAVGDVRAGNVKRVASAVGEGSIAVSFVHRVLAE